MVNRAQHENSERKAAWSGDIPVWKRVLDLLLVILFSPVWVPVILTLAVWVRLVSPGPVLFKQERVGFRRRKFTLYKLRSMKVDAAHRTHEQHFESLVREDIPMVKLDSKGDPRLIPGGRLIRCLGLDELPQLFNVLRGEMSIVGPRPCTARELELYSNAHYGRFETIPGLTGLWQVSGKNRTTFSEMIELDIRYAKTMSLIGDIGILLRTAPALIRQGWDLCDGLKRERSRAPDVEGESSFGMEHSGSRAQL